MWSTRGSRKFCQRGSSPDNVFFSSWDGERIEIAIKSGPLSARLRNVIEMAFHWQADDGPTLNAGLVAV